MRASWWLVVAWSGWLCAACGSESKSADPLAIGAGGVLGQPSATAPTAGGGATPAPLGTAGTPSTIATNPPTNQTGSGGGPAAPSRGGPTSAAGTPSMPGVTMMGM